MNRDRSKETDYFMYCIIHHMHPYTFVPLPISTLQTFATLRLRAVVLLHLCAAPPLHIFILVFTHCDAAMPLPQPAHSPSRPASPAPRVTASRRLGLSRLDDFATPLSFSFELLYCTLGVLVHCALAPFPVCAFAPLRNRLLSLSHSLALKLLPSDLLSSWLDVPFCPVSVRKHTHAALLK